MESQYQTKEIKATETKMKAPKPSKMEAPEKYDDGHIFEKDGMWLFKWKGGECGYPSKEAAETGLLKVSGKFKEED
tara:strand:+ start:125 stop:352 length:228 start_codon:yes stop_codon:yes gene_type:complete